MSPDTSLTLATVLSGTGVVASAALVTGLIALLKNLPQLGTWIDDGHEALVALLLSGVLVALAVADAHWTGLAALFQAFVVWYGIAGLTVGVHAAGSAIARATAAPAAPAPDPAPPA